MNDILNEREKIVLKMIVEEYIRTSEPVGSRFISKHSPLGLSPASIRNVMSDLEDKDMIKQTYISSGRVPSDTGLRYYVDKLISIKPFNENQIKDVLVGKRLNLKSVFDDITKKLGELTNSVGFVVSPKLNSSFLKHIEFIKLNKDSILAIIVTRAGIVHNIIIESENEIKENELTMISNYLNKNFSNRSLGELKDALRQEMLNDKEKIQMVYNKMLSLSKLVFEGIDDEYEIILHGINHIVTQPEFKKDLDTLKELLEILESKQKILDILNKLVTRHGIKIFIGSEIGDKVAQELGVVLTEYKRGSNIIGMLGVIGPKRMRYPEVLPIVDYTSKLITNILTEIGGDDEQ
ncbi:MAG: heat-inducible transcriptional repressor HrcA [Calditerrivibrio sp.]|nr:heat-inducible transcriptional repressor HrcA [Calditerrivibrio sp.]